MLRTSLSAVLVLLVTVPNAAADANSLQDYLGPREISLGESMRADATGTLATRLNPAGLALSRQLVFEGSYGFRPGDSASSAAVSACDSTVPVPGCFYYRYFAAEPSVGGVESKRRVHEVGMVGSRAITQQILIGTNVHYFDYESDLAGEMDSNGFSLDAGLIFRATAGVNLALVGQNLYSNEDSSQYPRAVATGLSVRASEMLGVSADAVWNLETPDGESTGRYGAGLELFLRSADRMSGYPIRAGVVHDRQLEGTYVTGGLGFATGKVALDVGARKQVDGGDELMVQAGLRFFGPTVQ